MFRVEYRYNECGEPRGWHELVNFWAKQFSGCATYPTLEEARKRLAKSAKHNPIEKLRIVEFTPEVPAVPERIIAVHPAVEPTRFTVQHWSDYAPEWLKVEVAAAPGVFDNLEAAQAAVEKAVAPHSFYDKVRAHYRILETPANIVHPVPLPPPEDVEVEIRVRVPRTPIRRVKLDMTATGGWVSADSECKVVSVKEVSRGDAS